MNTEERKAILAISLMAAFADGSKHERERAEVCRIAESLDDPQVNPAALYQDVLLRRLELDSVARAIGSPELRQYAYEMAVCVCDADGAHSAQETDFLARLQRALGLGAESTAAFTRDADRIAALPVTAPLSVEPSAPPVAQAVDAAALDKMVLNYAILNGALELLPQNLATVAIIPLQMKMVYRIGKAHGYELDRGHIKDFLGTLGVGMASQYVEQIGRKLIGGLLGQIAGGLGRGLGGAAAGAAFSFATTYALGHVARRYYADGRKLSADTLRQAYATMLEQGRGLQPRYLPEIQQKASTLDLNEVIQAARQ
jgi:uncharacterized protein (DUF697 family)/tellurite resistance protein